MNTLHGFCDCLHPSRYTPGTFLNKWIKPAISYSRRSTGQSAPAVYELPPDAVGESIVNAIAHRDYHSNASVEIRLFADRLEVWNPGALPGTLTLESLRVDHPSLPSNPLIAESLYLARYIEKAG